MSDEAKGRGRPRLRSDPGTRKRAHQERQREKLRLTDDLLDAVRNAQWDEPDLHRRVDNGTDAEVLQLLIEYYQKRYFWWVQNARARAAAAQGGEPGETT